MDITSINNLNAQLVDSIKGMDLPEGVTVESKVSEDNNLVITINNSDTNKSTTLTFTPAELDVPGAIDTNGDGELDASEIVAEIDKKIAEVEKAVSEEKGEGSISKIIFDIFQMMALLIVLAQTQRENAAKARHAEREQQAKLALDSAEQIRDAAKQAWTQALAGCITSGIGTLASMTMVGVSTYKALNSEVGAALNESTQDLKLANMELSPDTTTTNYTDALKGLPSSEAAKIQNQFSVSADPEKPTAIDSKVYALETLEKELANPDSTMTNEACNQHCKDIGIAAPEDYKTLTSEQKAELISSAREQIRADIKATSKEMINAVKLRLENKEITPKLAAKLIYAIKSGATAKTAKVSSPNQVAVDINNAKVNFDKANAAYNNNSDSIRVNTLSNLVNQTQTGLIGAVTKMIDASSDTIMRLAEAKVKENDAEIKMSEAREDQLREVMEKCKEIMNNARQLMMEVNQSNDQLMNRIVGSFA